jgi:hypothetical protein
MRTPRDGVDAVGADDEIAILERRQGGKRRTELERHAGAERRVTRVLLDDPHVRRGGAA